MKKLTLTIAITAMLMTSVSALKDGIDLFSSEESEQSFICPAMPEPAFEAAPSHAGVPQ